MPVERGLKAIKVFVRITVGSIACCCLTFRRLMSTIVDIPHR